MDVSRRRYWLIGGSPEDRDWYLGAPRIGNVRLPKAMGRMWPGCGNDSRSWNLSTPDRLNPANNGTNEGDLGESFTNNNTSRESEKEGSTSTRLVENNNQIEIESNQPNTNTHWMIHEDEKELGNIKEVLIKLEWKEAMNVEFKVLMSNQTWTSLPFKGQESIIDSKWIFKTKYKADGSIEQRKEKLVARVHKNDSGMYLRRTKYIKDTLKKFNMETISVCPTPMVVGRQFTTEGKPITNATLYRQAIGSKHIEIDVHYIRDQVLQNEVPDLCSYY
ncbi:hypothetical protein V8G54_012224 [Vigna mungo]|uniref:Reverse transcriptase Ty1/copia-type domain-containing protein n=1 Tax=Vigna mungo TaxID=3915 RepID=A0AAQ3S361_VIGMU